MNKEEFKEWLEKNGYSFWYKENDNEVWINTEYTIIGHPACGIKFQVPNDVATEEYLANTLC